ncbi:hypothetical protein F7Q99_22265 [Streptomyces kaniharaensis]|uniref:Polyprenyl synthetase family protein n=1 Tax=Streptomyces kaniharaensis TaxID=212423 RepID=A0A6N7KU04_9ACTN|nr:polyprenyl synthetase family protein [Streptomyces kaniharaensis]MQS14911.1 hypothetical protein [Streptomyces kaniharaensis]
MRRVETRLGGLLTQERDRRVAADGYAACLVGDIGALVRVGYRIRAAVCVTGYLAAGGDPKGAEIVDAAAALELLDTSHLIRHDTRDGAVLRRGLPTLHVSHAAEHERNGWRGESRRFGEGMAVLAGDLALALADRLAVGLPQRARSVWDELRTDRVLGAYSEAARAGEYRDEPWPAECLGDCGHGCAAGWYAVEQPLLLGAALAGRRDLDPHYGELGRAVHAGWRLRGFLGGGQGFDGMARLLREVLFDQDSHDRAELLITEQLDRARAALRAAPLRADWRAELYDCLEALTRP